jgi:hypothetical protein
LGSLKAERLEQLLVHECRTHAQFGNVTVVKEVTREMWRWAWLERLGQDLRFGARVLARNPGFTLIAVLTLALGIGANAAIFSVVSGVILRPLPYPRSEQLMYVSTRIPCAQRQAGPVIRTRILRASGGQPLIRGDRSVPNGGIEYNRR